MRTYITNPDEIGDILRKLHDFSNDGEWEEIMARDAGGCQNDADCGPGLRCVRGRCDWDV